MSKCKVLSIKEKLQIVNEVDSRIKKRETGLRFSVPANSLSTILKNRESIEKHAQQVNMNWKCFKTCVYEDLDEAVLKWFTVVHEKNIPVSGALIKKESFRIC